jgi:hypothetical protein
MKRASAVLVAVGVADNALTQLRIVMEGYEDEINLFALQILRDSEFFSAEAQQLSRSGRVYDIGQDWCTHQALLSVALVVEASRQDNQFSRH